ncbi:hypothetical protein CBP36_19530 (plasmid) [Acidovorax carolinensis]|jgi:hypothetical protein|uniref:Uncharacterized protein n=3 Tax=Acidovorax carolinensis TaxID=553814 RepID=A0A240UJG1_9BURK|nr:hypothetical protein CBP35_19485 [Acidovorax carolinensis]ART61160.1 hypothetical protein CBP36_19530 [Acidovorax carolinensis]
MMAPRILPAQPKSLTTRAGSDCGAVHDLDTIAAPNFLAAGRHRLTLGDDAIAKTEPAMAYKLTLEALESITDVEMAFGTDRLLPAWEDIPDDFKQGNDFTQIACAIFFASQLPLV